MSSNQFLRIAIDTEKCLEIIASNVEAKDTGNQNAKTMEEVDKEVEVEEMEEIGISEGEASNHQDVVILIVTTETIDTTPIDDMANHPGFMTIQGESTDLSIDLEVDPLQEIATPTTAVDSIMAANTSTLMAGVEDITMLTTTEDQTTQETTKTPDLVAEAVEVDMVETIITTAVEVEAETCLHQEVMAAWALETIMEDHLQWIEIVTTVVAEEDHLQ